MKFQQATKTIKFEELKDGDAFVTSGFHYIKVRPNRCKNGEGLEVNCLCLDTNDLYNAKSDLLVSKIPELKITTNK